MIDDDNMEPDGEGPSTEDAASMMAADKIKAGQSNKPAQPLNVDHPYGDGKHMEGAGATLKRLGAGKKYGGQ